MEIVKAYKSKDGEVYQDEVECAQADFKVDLRGYFNRTMNKDNIHINELTRVISTNSGELQKMIANHGKIVNNINGRAKRRENHAAKLAGK